MIKAPENASVDAGTEAKFSCVMGGDPSPQIKWIRKGGKVSYVSAAEDDAAVLRIKNVSEAESGKYVCQAENIAGVDNLNHSLYSRIIIKYFLKIFYHKEKGQNFF